MTNWSYSMSSAPLNRRVLISYTTISKPIRPSMACATWDAEGLCWRIGISVDHLTFICVEPHRVYAWAPAPDPAPADKFLISRARYGSIRDNQEAGT